MVFPAVIVPGIFTQAGREWYENGTKSVTKDGVENNITSTGTGPTQTTTIIVTPTGVTDTTSDV